MNMKTMTSCKEAARLMSQQLDHPLSLSDRILLRIHLVMCISCTYYGRQIKALKDIIQRRKQPEDELPFPHTPSLSDETRERIKTLLHEENS